MIPFNAGLATDGYKTGHHQQYPKGTEIVYSNITPRSDKLANATIRNGKIIAFGMQMAISRLHDLFQKDFFAMPLEQAIGQIKRELSMYLSTDYDVSHFEALHKLGYLPIEIRHVPEGTELPIRLPVLTIHNTLPEFYWLPNFLETVLSIYIWRPLTSATIAYGYKKILHKYNQETDKENTGIWFQAHDFSMRGLTSIEDACVNGVAHLTSFMGTDSLPALWAAREYYGVSENDTLAFSVPATEHSVMCANGTEGEFETFRNLISNVYPTGIVSIVSDTWDLWRVLTDYLPRLKDTILNREGKVVIRPDSGDPIDILCGEIKEGTIDASELPKYKGVIELLWDVFGGTINQQGYKVLDPHIGAIYGDSITPERCIAICERLKAKGFATTNVVYGIGSFTYQFNTRDTYGIAMKATWAKVDGIGRALQKDPITDSGVKKSAKGLLGIIKDTEGNYFLLENQKEEDVIHSNFGLLETHYLDGVHSNKCALSEIRNKLHSQL